ncbi:hypothetical protein [Methylomonas rosea]|uniref:Uncharacterized protein n=1 Tax=Methylomonas rosea TaxID=2952227 RepID=A0ABT1TT64_9GAMM|nr:hypothetical protein [Methylomonas sp. WSC-7]MCQ8117758.1 hypothetical protein [Methylomonas sp. WSC-7]
MQNVRKNNGMAPSSSKKYHSLQTPCQRVIDHPDILDATKHTLREYHAELYPFAIKVAIV